MNLQKPVLKCLSESLFVKEGTRLVRMNLDEIQYIQSRQNYIIFVTNTRRVIALQTMKEIERFLPPERFTRVHRSYIISLDKISSIEKNKIQIAETMIPVGRLYQHTLRKIFQY